MPESIETRLARLEAFEQIRQLASRYGIAVDSRNMPAIAALFVDDGRPVFFRGTVGALGGKALQESYIATQSQYTGSQHYMCNHQIDLDDATHAHGIVYAIVRQEREGKYFVIQMAYRDKYEKVGEEWLFAERKPGSWKRAAWHTEGVGQAPGGAAASPSNAGPNANLFPEAYESWRPFWEEVAKRKQDGRLPASTTLPS